MKEAPFYVGQKVVTLASTKIAGGLKKGTIVTVSDCVLCRCGAWMVGVIEKPAHYDESNHEQCGGWYQHHGSFYYHGNAKYFAPIEENTYEDVTKELAVLPTDEVPDVKKIKDLVN